jgi:hypothetical protein
VSFRIAGAVASLIDWFFPDFSKDQQEVVAQMHEDANGGAPQGDVDANSQYDPSSAQAGEEDQWIDEEMDPQSLASTIDHVVADPK